MDVYFKLLKVILILIVKGYIFGIEIGLGQI